MKITTENADYSDDVKHWVCPQDRCRSVQRAAERCQVPGDFTDCESIGQIITFLSAVYQVYRILHGANTQLDENDDGKYIALWYSYYNDKLNKAKPKKIKIDSNAFTMWYQKHFLSITGIDRIRRKVQVKSVDDLIIERPFEDFCRIPKQIDVFIDCNHVEDQDETKQGMGVIILGMNPRPIKISIPHHDGRAFSLGEARLSAVTKAIELLDTKYRRNMKKKVCIWVKDERTQDILTYKCKRSDRPDLAKKQDDAWRKYVDMIKKDFRKINYQVHALENENNLDCA